MATKAVIFLQGLKNNFETDAKLKALLLAFCFVLNVSRLNHIPLGGRGYSHICALLERGSKIRHFCSGPECNRIKGTPEITN